MYCLSGERQVIPTPRIGMLVDDDAASLLLGSRTSEKCGWTVLRADGPARAMELFVRVGLIIDVLVIAAEMPGTSGYQLAASFRRRKPGLEVLCLSLPGGQSRKFCASTGYLHPNN
jgi:DNA-binding response OmpR family regulator